jgi:hypothetical protein
MANRIDFDTHRIVRHAAARNEISSLLGRALSGSPAPRLQAPARAQRSAAPSIQDGPTW